jgi:TatA/E family protein of Tat protein translocase
MGNLGFWEILIIAGVAVFLFGSKRIADIGKGLGNAMREADGDAARIVAIAFVMTVVAIVAYWLSVCWTASHR